MINIVRLLIILVLYNGLSAFIMSATATANQTAYDSKLYSEIYNGIASFESSFTVSYEGDEDSAAKQLKLILEDIRKKNSYLYENMTRLEASMKPHDNGTDIQFSIVFLTSKEKEKYVDEQVEKVLSSIRKEKLSQQEMIKAVHDYIVLNTEYSYNTKGSSYSAYTALTEKKGVCQAYSLLMQKMLEELGMEVKYIKGKAGGAAHSWNLVKIAGEWRHIDATWDDPIDNKAETVRYQYFLKTDQEMVKTHSWHTVEYPKAVRGK